ncbi:helix-hairpin-helix domain-containing protein [Sphingomonas mollis]|uniref:helix-hairpin-helix domain-containing protein n=1 Tax=Sphingomonas mollis TaxID=2795726 RepID=UPI002FCDF307
MSAPDGIDINVATADEIDALSALKGHGFEIVRYREERGRFDALRQLEEVPGLTGKVAGLDGMVRFG